MANPGCPCFRWLDTTSQHTPEDLAVAARPG